MSNNGSTSNSGVFPVIAAAGTALIASIFSAVAVALDEEDAEEASNGILGIAADVISSSIMDGRGKRSGTNQNEHKRRRVICWDCQRAKFCIDQDYLGPQPSFGPDEFRRIFRVS
jgi:hypothetical protein